MDTVTEVYVSCVEQKIEGIVYGVNQVVLRAASLATLAALLKTNRIRLTGFAPAPAGPASGWIVTYSSSGTPSASISQIAWWVTASTCAVRVADAPMFAPLVCVIVSGGVNGPPEIPDT